MNAVAVQGNRTVANIDTIKNDLSRRADEFKMVLPAHISVEKFQRVIATAALSNPAIFGCDRQSLLIAAMKLAQDGLLPDGREAALVPFKNRVKNDSGKWDDVWMVQAMPMAWGLRKKILQSGEVISLETGVVYRAEMEARDFIYEIGIDPPIRHRPKMDLTDEEMGDDNIVAAYSIARLKNEHGDPYWSVEVMRRAEINKVRQTSQTGAVGRVVKFGNDKGKVIEPKGPWVDWFGEMARKTVLRRHSKVLPMSGDLLDTIERDREEELRAESAARLLAAEAETPRSLPSAEELDAQAGEGETIDAETGEITQTDSRGITEVDEETARALDAGDQGEGPAQEQRGEEQTERQADHVGPAAPENPARNSTWFNPKNDRYAYAHHTPNGVKWYLQPQKDPEPQAQQESVAEAAEEPAAEEEQPMWVGFAAEVRKLVAVATDMKSWKAAEKEFLKVYAGLPEDEGKKLEAELVAKRKALQPVEGSSQ